MVRERIAAITRPTIGAAVPRHQKITIRSATPAPRGRSVTGAPASARAEIGRSTNSVSMNAIPETTIPAMPTVSPVVAARSGWMRTESRVNTTVPPTHSSACIWVSRKGTRRACCRSFSSGSRPLVAQRSARRVCWVPNRAPTATAKATYDGTAIANETTVSVVGFGAGIAK